MAEPRSPRELNVEQLRQRAAQLVAEGKVTEAVQHLLDVIAHLALDRQRLLRKHLGRTSERVNEAQLSLLQELLGEITKDATTLQGPGAELPDDVRPKKQRKGHGRGKLPDDLARVDNVIPVPEAERACPHCGGDRECIGFDVSETLERKPAEMYVIVNKREKLACRPCEQGVTTAPAPDQVIEKGRPGPGLLTDVIIGKYVDHLPLNRQRAIYQREGVDIPISTMVDWVAAVARSLSPLALRLESLVLGAYVVNADDTGVKVLDRDEPGGAKRGHLWCYVGDRQYCVFRYTPDWSKEGPQAFLDSRVGWLHVDAYKGWDGLFNRANATAIEVACWAHARRPFAELALNGDARAGPVVALVRELYAVESRASEAGVDEETRLKRRQAESAPLVDQIVRACREIRGRYPPTDPLAKAGGYVVNQERALRRFLEDARLYLDNTVVERRLRPVACGRKNYLFCGSDTAAERAAVIYSLMGSCALAGLDPRAYLTWVLAKLEIERVPMHRIDELLPHAWASICPASARILPSR